MAYTKPLPVPTNEDRPFWEAAKRHEFVLPRCRDCGNRWFPPYANCTRCLSPDREFVPASGRGVIWGAIEMAQNYLPAFAPELPYNVILVQLDEGPMIFSNLAGLPNDQIKIGMPVEVFFEDATEEFALPKFRPAS